MTFTVDWALKANYLSICEITLVMSVIRLIIACIVHMFNLNLFLYNGVQHFLSVDTVMFSSFFPFVACKVVISDLAK